MYEKAAEGRKSFLEGFGIVPPPHWRGCENLIRYIKFGIAGVPGKNLGERVAIIRNTQKKYLGKRVRVTVGTQSHLEGTVIYLTALSAQRVADARTEEYTPTFIRFMVRGDDGKSLGLKTKMALNLVE